ncbi:MAG: LCP family protein [Roseiflexus sp.]|nr:LCP family protein [Roseiflexus sp.]MCS7289370.1 LCP family protein [Roseiflexus sp.]MDW8145107.1 LCP family protein [Roseiflexaceae bacterium]MDW8233313.1 LCP family protein [Roseiflexaceae bacterium]
MRDRYDSEPTNRPPRQRAYTGETIVMRRARVAAPPVQRSVWQRIRRALMLTGVLLAALIALLYWQFAAAVAPLIVADARPFPPLNPPGTAMNVLLIGVDERPDHPEEGVRSDTLIVVRLDTIGRRISLLSIPRDTRVDVRDIGPTKINVAYGYGYAAARELYGEKTMPAQGGMALAAETVGQFLDLPIHYTAQINFDGFARVIDALGGVTIDVPRRIVDDAYPTPDFGTVRVEFEPGPQRMDGARALIYARTRHADSDFGRAERQQQVIRAVIEELRARGPIGAALLLPSLGRALDGAFATTLPLSRPDMLLGMGWIATGLDPAAIGQYRIAPDTAPNFREIGSDILWDPAEVRKVVRDFLATPGVETEDARIQVLNGAGVTGLARRVSGELESAGFTVVPAADAPRSDVPRTVVYDVTGKPATARRLAALLNAEIRRGPPDGVSPTVDIIVVLGRDQVK